MNDALRDEIMAMVEADQRMRKEAVEQLDQELDKRNTQRMQEIIKECGWPGKSLVGEEAAKGAWLLVQHADHDPAFQREVLTLLQDAVKEGEAGQRHEAMLTDRVLVNEGKLQMYGTQFYEDERGNFGPRPIEDAERLDEKRASVGLPPFAEYEADMRNIRAEGLRRREESRRTRNK